jgi:predicted outer membrane repeat protein
MKYAIMTINKNMSFRIAFRLLLFLSTTLLMIVTMGQACSDGLILDSGDRLISSLGNGEGYQGKLIVRNQIEKDFTCEGKQAPKKTLFTAYYGPNPIDPGLLTKETEWSLIENTKDRCAKNGEIKEVVTGVEYEIETNNVVFDGKVFEAPANEYEYTIYVTSGENIPDSSDANIEDRICDNGQGQCTIRAALEEVNQNTGAIPILVNIPAGHYTMDQTIALNKSVIISGELKLSTVIHARSPGYSFLNLSGSNKEFIIRNMTIQYFANNSSGGAISSTNAVTSGSSIKIKNVFFRHNSTRSNNASGGAISTYFDELSIEQSRFLSNFTNVGGLSNRWGGAISFRGKNLYVNQSSFEDNRSGSTYGGGAIYSNGSTSIQQSEFRSNYYQFNTTKRWDNIILDTRGENDPRYHSIVNSSVYTNISGDDYTFSGAGRYYWGRGSHVYIRGNPSNRPVVEMNHNTFNGTLGYVNLGPNGEWLGNGNVDPVPNTGFLLADNIQNDSFFGNYIAYTGSPAPNCASPLGVGGFRSTGYNIVRYNHCVRHPSDLIGFTYINSTGRQTIVNQSNGLTYRAPRYVDRIPESECRLAIDQNNHKRPKNGACDIGAFEWQFPDSAID